MSLQTADSRIVPNSQGGLGLLAVPIGLLREQEADRVSDSLPSLHPVLKSASTKNIFYPLKLCSFKKSGFILKSINRINIDLKDDLRCA